MKASDLQTKSREELNHLLADLRSKLLKLNFDLADNKIKDTSQLKKTKQDIARVITILNNQRPMTND